MHRGPSIRQMQRAENLLTGLGYLYPILEEGIPLRCGIHQDLIDRGGHGETPVVVKAAIHRHTRAPAYLMAVARGGYRYDLDGRRREVIATAHQRHARAQLIELGIDPPGLPAGTARRPTLSLSKKRTGGTLA